MNARDWLRRGWEINNLINQLIEKQEKALSIACKVTPTLVLDKVQACGGKSREDWVITYTEYADEINNKIDELYKIKCEILHAIKKVDNDTYKTLLEERYVNFKTWGQIAERINKPESTTKGRIHGRALQAITLYLV